MRLRFLASLKYRLDIPLFDEPFPCPALSSGEGKACGSEMDVFGDHAPCCLHGPSLVFRHNNVRDILGHSGRAAGLAAAARAAGLAAVVIEKKNQIEGSKATSPLSSTDVGV